MWASFGSHKDICSWHAPLGFGIITELFHAAWISTDISYGLFLADHKILGIVESQMVILSAIMFQNLAGATHWHLRGCLRLGLSRTEVEQLQVTIESIAQAFGKSLDKVGRVADVKDE